MDVNNEILDAIEIMVGRAMKNSAAIYTCRVVSVNADKTCLVAANGGEYTVRYYGAQPKKNEPQPLFVPYSNMSKAFMIVVGDGGSTPEPTPTDNPYITFSSPTAFTVSVNATGGWDGTVEYSTNAASWSTWDGSSTSAVQVGGKYVLYMRGINNTCLSHGIVNRFVITGSDVSCDGNVETMLDYATVVNGGHPTMVGFALYALFYECTALVSCPSLPATELAEYCYGSMFQGCTNLTTIPKLPATTLAEACYITMFSGCSKIKLSTAQTGEYTQGYRIPSDGTGTAGTNSVNNMFINTGGTAVGSPTINTTYYLSNTNKIV